ncbi:MAG: redoxin domain-containing protein [Planctomycetes bacterium]|nr:redoxin domain-containing protein [Planctomycetota bacterium]
MRCTPLLVVFVCCGLTWNAPAAEEGRAGEPFSGVRGWINTAEPLTRERLTGQVVLIDFWTYCCINCMHIIPDLHRLEATFTDQPFTVVGVHCGKFDQEKDVENIRSAVNRYRIVHPVAVDSDFAVWRRFGATAWPTLVLLDAHGKVAGRWSGEGHHAAIEAAVARLLETGRIEGVLAAAPLVLQSEPAPAQAALRPLDFPGKVIADAAGKRLFIADSGHHRVLVADLDGTVARVLGSGLPGLEDGPAATARFNDPQGLALDAAGTTLFVADRLNHALRAVDLGDGRVRTLAGDGEQGENRAYAGPSAAAQLISPWDLCRIGDGLFIAMAGSHQIWRLGLDDGQLRVHAGNGREIRRDGPNRGAAFAQPSGLASSGDTLYVADSEISSIRAVDVASDGVTRTVAGSGDLFGFGLIDGVGGDVRFQHCLGITVSDGAQGPRLIVADTYNNCLREVDPNSGAVRQIAGPPAKDGAPGLFEPAGVTTAGDRLYVTDTGNHRLMQCSDGRWSELTIILPSP